MGVLNVQRCKEYIICWFSYVTWVPIIPVYIRVKLIRFFYINYIHTPPDNNDRTRNFSGISI
jgi:hypothetical protein